jgi:methionyl-tRNA formyltransferase
MNHTETSKELYETLFQVASDKLPEIINGHSTGSIKPIPQDEDKATYTFSRTHPHHTHIFKEDALINWKNEAWNIEQKIRALSPWPIAWTYLKELQDASCLAQGKLKFREHTNPELTVKIHSAHMDGNKLWLDKLQIEGKNIMTWEEFKNGYIA